LNRRWWIAVLTVLLVYSVLALNHLAAFPPVGQDEPWIAAAPYKLATRGIYGSDLFAGHYGMDRHDFDHMPLYPLLQAGTFKLFGVGTFQMRIAGRAASRVGVGPHAFFCHFKVVFALL
jgi:4-amino-4-deoxy-L-arabinose transferase-like glycosyltransferase